MGVEPIAAVTGQEAGYTVLLCDAAKNNPTTMQHHVLKENNQPAMNIFILHYPLSFYS